MQLTSFRPFLCLALAAAALSGCSTMNRTECLAVDWQTIGYEDGVAGRSGDHIAQHRKACAKHGVRADLNAYQTGREQGLREYCQPANGYRIGVNGGSYGGICPSDLEPGFASAFDAGHELYTLRSRVWNTQSEIDSKRRELDRIQKRLASNSVAVLDKEVSNEDRAEALADTATLAERAGRLKAEIRALEEDKVRYEHDLDRYQAAHLSTT